MYIYTNMYIFLVCIEKTSKEWWRNRVQTWEKHAKHPCRHWTVRWQSTINAIPRKWTFIFVQIFYKNGQSGMCHFHWSAHFYCFWNILYVCTSSCHYFVLLVMKKTCHVQEKHKLSTHWFVLYWSSMWSAAKNTSPVTACRWPQTTLEFNIRGSKWGVKVREILALSCSNSDTQIQSV